MVTSEALKVDVTGNSDLSKIYRHKAILSSDSSDWGGLYWRYYRQPPFEMVEHSCPQHRIIVNDRALRSPIAETFEGENQLNPVSPGTVRVLPANSRSRAYWETEHQFMMLAFEPELLTRQIIDTTDVDPVGLSPHQYVIQCRIDRAKQLLLQSKLSIAEIAHHLGFTHQSHFSHHFKRIVGSSPKAFLKAQ